MVNKKDDMGDPKATATPNTEQQSGMGLVLSADSLPDVLPLIPITERPAFPGMLLPIMILKGPVADAAYAAATTGSQAVGLVLTKKAVSPSSLPDAPELYSYGAAAKILKVQKAENEAVQLLLTSLKRFRIRKMIKKGPDAVAAVQYYEEPAPEDDDETHALARFDQRFHDSVPQ